MNGSITLGWGNCKEEYERGQCNNHFPPINDLKDFPVEIFYDCDGVLTDNRVHVTENGVESVFFNRSDGLASFVSRV